MKMPHARITRLLAVAAVTAIGLIDPAIALARAGGGQNYGGSGGSGGFGGFAWRPEGFYTDLAGIF